jgi:hypothetical protein
MQRTEQMAIIIEALRSFREIYVFACPQPTEYTKQVYKNVQLAGAIAMDLLEEFEKERDNKHERTN